MSEDIKVPKFWIAKTERYVFLLLVILLSSCCLVLTTGDMGHVRSETELSDSRDNDCDGRIDEGFTTRRYYLDADGDGYGDSSNYVWDVTPPQGYVTNGNDNCVDVANPGQGDIDGDGLGDACDSSDDRPPAVVPDPGGCSMSSEAEAMLEAVNNFRAQARSCGGSAYPAAAALT